jgi:DNA-binding beta-propeller fold protein YncE
MAERGFRQTLVIVAAASTVVAALTPAQAETVAGPPRSELWVSRFNGPANTQDGGSAIRVSPDGSKVYVTGHGHFDFADDYTTSAHDAASGAVLWASRYDGTGGSVDVAYAMALSPDGSRLFVTGASAGTAGEDVATVAYDTVDGSRLWVSRGVPHIPDYGGAIAVSPDGSRVFVTGA